MGALVAAGHLRQPMAHAACEHRREVRVDLVLRRGESIRAEFEQRSEALGPQPADGQLAPRSTAAETEGSRSRWAAARPPRS